MTPLTVVFTLLLIALALAVIRLVRGPTLPDRVVALDLIAMVFAGMVAAHAVKMNLPILLDVLLVFSGIFFFGTAAFAHYLDKRGQEEIDD